MNKTWWINNLATVGKWGGLSLLSGVAITVFMFVPMASPSRILDSFGIGRANLPLIAYVSEPKLDFNVSGKIDEVTLPINNLINDALGGLKLNRSINIGTWMPLSPTKTPSADTDYSKFFSSSRVSSSDVGVFLKEAAITGINLSILIVSITVQVLKGLLSAIK